MEQKKFYITTPIYYTNGEPHLGNAYTTVVADTIARYRRSQNEETFFLTGTADHGEKIVRSAKDAGMGPQAFVDQNVEKFKELFKKLDISNDYFIRNSDKKNHWPGAQALWTKLHDSGDLYKGMYKGLYCVGCEAFKTNKDLVEGKCPDHDVEPEEVEQENYFFRLSKYTEKIKKILEENKILIFPQSRKQELLSFVEEGLEDISFSRPEGDIPWGIPVPNDPTQMMYVWCEELSNYISALGYGRKDDENFKKFWPADVHILGKDILRFHAIVWPAMLISAGLPLPKKILAHGMLISNGKKMSKTIGNIINPNDLIEKYGAEAVRYYLIREISPFEDGDITEEKFKVAYNANLANGLGNLLSRTLKMAEQYFGGTVTRGNRLDVTLKSDFPTVSGGIKRNGITIFSVVSEEILPRYHKHMQGFEIHKASDVVWELIGILDGYIAEYEPFKLIKTDRDKAENIIWNVLYGISNVSIMIEAMMPNTAKEIQKLITTKKGEDKDSLVFNIVLPEKPLFIRAD